MSSLITRRRLLALALVGTVTAAIMAPQKDDDALVVEPIRHGAVTTAPGVVEPRRPTSVDSLAVLKLEPRRTAPATTLFVIPPPPKPVVVAAVASAPVAPVEPPLPAYTVIGRYDSGSSQLVLLASGRDTLEVQAGDTVGNGWRVGSIDEDRIIFISPSGKQQLLSIADGS
jgi:hypothetical protein